MFLHVWSQLFSRVILYAWGLIWCVLVGNLLARCWTHALATHNRCMQVCMNHCLWRPMPIVLLVCISPMVLCKGKRTWHALAWRFVFSWLSLVWHVTISVGPVHCFRQTKNTCSLDCAISCFPRLSSLCDWSFCRIQIAWARLFLTIRLYYLPKLHVVYAPARRIANPILPAFMFPP